VAHPLGDTIGNRFVNCVLFPMIYGGRVQFIGRQA
jgi:hypothetical protein